MLVSTVRLSKSYLTAQYSRLRVESGLLCALDRREALALDILRNHAGF